MSVIMTCQETAEEDTRKRYY